MLAMLAIVGGALSGSALLSSYRPARGGASIAHVAHRSVAPSYPRESGREADPAATTPLSPEAVSLRIAAAVAGPSPAGVETACHDCPVPPGGTPGAPLRIDLPLTLDQTVAQTGDTLHGRIVLRNPGSSPILANRIIMTWRQPGGTHVGGPYDDFGPALDGITIPPGGTVGLVAGRMFGDETSDPDGTYDVYAVYQTGGRWYDSPSVLVEKTSRTRQSAAVRMEATSGNAQSGVAGTALAQPLVVRVLNAGGCRVPGFPVRFSSNGIGDRFWPPEACTDACGQASTRWTLGVRPGTASASAAPSAPVAPLPVAFTARATAWTAPVMHLLWTDRNAVDTSSPSTATLNATTTLTNFGTSGLPILRLGIEARPVLGVPGRPDDRVRFAGAQGPTTVAAGRELRANTSTTFTDADLAGDWEVYAVVDTFEEGRTVSHHSQGIRVTVATRRTLGAFITDLFPPATSAETAPFSTRSIDGYAGLTGAQPRIIMWFVGWNDVSQPVFQSWHFSNAASRGAVPMITWEPHVRLSDVLSGNYDAYLRSCAAATSAWGGPIYLKFAHEMNGTWYPWTALPRPWTDELAQGNTPRLYKDAWIHVVDVFRRYYADHMIANNVRWVWAPNVEFDASCPFEDCYPGDEYVDWVGLDGYNWGTTTNFTGWVPFDRIFRSSYEKLSRLSSRPLLIAETSCLEPGGSKAQWMTDGFLGYLPSNMPRMRGAVMFHIRKYEDYVRTTVDWRVDSSEAARLAWRSIVLDPRYQGRLR